MSAVDLLELELFSDPAMLRNAREVARRWCVDHGWIDEQIAEIVLALDEALTNVIRHGYEGTPNRKINVQICGISHAGRGEGVEIIIRDYGKQVELDQICGRDLDEPRPGGLGVHIIKAMMDVADYSHADGGGIRLVMRKYKSSKRRADDAS